MQLKKNSELIKEENYLAVSYEKKEEEETLTFTTHIIFSFF